MVTQQTDIARARAVLLAWLKTVAFNKNFGYFSLVWHILYSVPFFYYFIFLLFSLYSFYIQVIYWGGVRISVFLSYVKHFELPSMKCAPQIKLPCLALLHAGLRHAEAF